MFDDKKQQFTFRCNECKIIITSEFEDEKDIEDIKEGLLYFECPCGGISKLLTS